MAYSAANHDVFSERMKNWFGSIQNDLEEGERLDQIYVNETVSGSDADFIDTAIATKAEHQDGITFFREFRDFIKGTAAVSQTDRRDKISPFTQ